MLDSDIPDPGQISPDLIPLFESCIARQHDALLLGREPQVFVIFGVLHADMTTAKDRMTSHFQKIKKSIRNVVIGV